MILPPAFSRRLLLSSHLAVIAAAVAFYFGHPLLCIVDICVYGTSILYWSHPTPGLRRLLDRMTINVAISIHVAILPLVYLFIPVMALGAYVMARGDTDLDRSSRWHRLAHVIGFVGNVVFYVLTS